MRPSTTILSSLLAMGIALSACSDRKEPTAPPSIAPPAVAARDTGAATFTPIVVSGATLTLPLDINDHGQVVGRYASGGRTHGFFRDASGELTTIDYPGATFTVAAGINDGGVIVGWYILPAAPTVRHGFRLEDGEFTSFDPSGSTFTNALGINARGDISGRFCVLAVCRGIGSGDFHGFLLRDGEFTVIDVPGADETDAFKIDARGAIEGGFNVVGSPAKAFVLRNGELTTFALPNGKAITEDNGGMNASGDIVGTYCDNAVPCLIASTGTHAFVFHAGELTTIDYPGARETAATGINARGDVVGGFVDANGPQGYLLSGRGRAN